MGISFWQVALILVVVLIVFGAGKLPRVMGDLASGIKNFKKGMNDPDSVDVANANKQVRSDESESSAALEKDKAAHG